MDLRTIKEKINLYGSMSDFLVDVRLMFQNCSTFNRVRLTALSSTHTRLCVDLT